MRNPIRMLWRTISASLLTLSVQASAIVLLAPRQYGQFALFYVMLGLGSAAVYALVSEAWVRSIIRVDDWVRYCTALISVGVFLALPTTVIAFVVGEPVLGVVAAIAVVASLYRLGARFFVVSLGDYRCVALADTLSVILFWVSLLATLRLWNGLAAVTVAWAIGALTSSVLSKRARISLVSDSIWKWLSERWSAIRFLAFDAALLETGSTAVPLALTPFMGLADFGVYRSISSAAVPVRLIVNPLRPNIARRSAEKMLDPRVVGGTLLVGLLLGGGVWVVLVWVGYAEFASASTLAALAGHALPVGLFVTMNFVATFYYVSLRTQARGTALMRYRATQTVLTIVIPISAYLLFGLSGAVWGYVILSSLALVHSIRTLKASGRDESREGEF